ncbi:IDEAL domain-containing protein [Rossellomorea sp. BNER]|uniref:IDEAL domain-containing protein n=1 Tax=Rossellomorea sp. BNER TaxID=2962031 RepID=UPI003AF2EA64|nr:IDEAL domain-containing protein [Rossellomorea sp. BNER]
MDKKKSYTEMMKACAMTRKSATDLSMMDVYIDMILSEILLNSKKEKLEQKINDALDERNEEDFLVLSHQLKDLHQQFEM